MKFKISNLYKGMGQLNIGQTRNPKQEEK